MKTLLRIATLVITLIFANPVYAGFKAEDVTAKDQDTDHVELTLRLYPGKDRPPVPPGITIILPNFPKDKKGQFEVWAEKVSKALVDTPAAKNLDDVEKQILLLDKYFDELLKTVYFSKIIIVFPRTNVTMVAEKK